MTSILPRGRRLYAKLKDVTGKWHRIPTPYQIGQEIEAAEWAKDRQGEVDRELARRERFGGPLTVRAFALRWLDARKTKTVADDRNRIVKHVLPRIGHMLLADVRPRHLRDLVMELRADPALAPKTIREIASITSTMFKSAVFEELIASSPAVFEKGTLPKKQDKDPAWRAQAIFTRAEIETIISDERIPEDRRVIYALKFFCGRHTEVLSSTWARYDASTEPLGTIHVVETKSGIARAVPVHPTLAKILAAWKLGGWERTYGDDLIVRTRRAGNVYAAADTQVRFVEDLGKLELRTKASTRNRRGHDLRRTLITLARADGAIDSLLRWITHGPKPGEILDVYSSPPWESLCGEIAKLRVRLLEGKIVALPTETNGIRGPSLVQPSEAGDIANENERPRRSITRVGPGNPCRPCTCAAPIAPPSAVEGSPLSAQRAMGHPGKSSNDLSTTISRHHPLRCTWFFSKSFTTNPVIGE
jgi:integrase